MIDSTVAFKVVSGAGGAYIGGIIGIVTSSILVKTGKMADTNAFAILTSVGAFVGLMLALYLVCDRKNSEQDDNVDLDGSDANVAKTIEMRDMVGEEEEDDDDDLDNPTLVSPVGSIQ